MIESSPVDSVPLVDAHCHLDLFSDPRGAVEQAERLRVYTIAVTNAPSVFSHTAALTSACTYIRAAAGLHPELVDSRAGELAALWPLLETTRYVGEIGLDYSAGDDNSRARQRRVFSEILERCARYKNKVLTVHSRRAHRDVIDAVGDRYPGRVILHWYSGTVKEIDRAISYGFYFSINSAMTLSDNGRRIIDALPSDRILTETDGPFVKVDGQGARPHQTSIVSEYLARRWKIGPVDAQRIILTNFRAMLDLPTDESDKEDC